MKQEDDDGLAEGGGGGPAEAPPRESSAAPTVLVRRALSPVVDALSRLGELPVVGGGVKQVMALLASLGRDEVSSVAESRREFGTEGEAKAAFTRAARELLAPNAWSAVSGVENASFRHFDAQGRAVAGRRRVEVGDFVEIVLPFAGAERSDWVRVALVASEPDSALVVVRPSHDPLRRPARPEVIAHFFGPEALNSFALTREGRTLIARIQGVHERANTGPAAGSPAAALRHRLAAEAGWGARRTDRPPDTTLDGPQQHQWNRFTANLLGNGFKA